MKLLRLFLSCSRTDLRRSKTKKRVVFLFLIFSAFFLYPQSAELNFSIRDNNLFVFLDLVEYDSEDMLLSLKEGFRSEIVFHIRLYEENTGVFEFIGDKLIYEVNPVYEARWDLVNNGYTITTEKNGEKNIIRFIDRKDFLGFFLKLSDCRIDKVINVAKKCYLTGRVSICSIKLPAPFTVPYLLMGGSKVTTPWKRLDLDSMSIEKK